MAPPPTRGWTEVRGVHQGAARGSPAHAGMDPVMIGRMSPRTRLPRPRGDGPDPRERHDGREQAPPPTRGWTHRRADEGRDLAGSPAHAGMDPRGPRAGSSAPGLPRPRGDGPICRAYSAEHDSAPPPTRGWTRQWHARIPRRQGSPAHAGMDRCAPRQRDVADGLPRPRGDGPELVVMAANPSMAPPPTRGWTQRAGAVAVEARGSPAHAGMDPAG